MNEINFRMNRERMIRMLQAFDQELDKPLRLVITGASALIIQGSITRGSKDIDVLNASEDLSKERFQTIIEKLAHKYSLNSDWLNSKAQLTLIDLPGYKPDLIRIDGGFKFLEPFIISKADSVITKFAMFENIRSWDEQDIKTTQFAEDDFIMVRRKLDNLYINDPQRALRIEIKFKAIKPEFIRTEEGFKFSNSAEIAQYALKRFGIILEKPYKEYIDENASNSNTSYEKAIIEIDNMAISKILNKNTGNNYGKGV